MDNSLVARLKVVPEALLLSLEFPFVWVFTTAWSVFHNANREGYHQMKRYLQISIRGLSTMDGLHPHPPPPEHGCLTEGLTILPIIRN
jgi:hypothetical protein